MNPAPVVVLASRNERARGELRQALTSDGFQSYEAATADETLDLAAQHNSAVILLDSELGNTRAAEICDRLKSDERFTGAIALVLPASADSAGRVGTSFDSADIVLSEPVLREALGAIVRCLSHVSQCRGEFAGIGGRIANLEQQLCEARAEVERLASQVCHDVEEPLRAVTTFAQLVDERPEARLSEPERAYLEHVLNSSERVRRLLRAFLSYTQAGKPGKNRSGRVDLRIAAVSAAQSLKQRIAETGAAIEIEKTLPSAPGDFGELQQVFEHAIRNAIDYGRPGSVVNIIVSGKAVEGEECVITIADNGAGIPADHHTSVFAPFKRLHGRDIPGAGMGLAISKRIIEAHGGRIWAESAADGGTQLRFRLPLAHA